MSKGASASPSGSRPADQAPKGLDAMRFDPSRIGDLFLSVWRQAEDNHRAYSAMGDHESEIRFLSLGLTGEAGELANFIKKRWRDGDAYADDIPKEIADVCAYAFMLASEMGLTPFGLLEIMAHKQAVFIAKMQARDERSAANG